MQSRGPVTNSNKEHQIEEPWITYTAILINSTSLIYCVTSTSELVPNPNLSLTQTENELALPQNPSLMSNSHHLRITYTYTNTCPGPQP